MLSVGRYHKKKGFDLIPKAIDKLIKNGIDFEWTIIGKNLKNVSFLNDDKYKNYIKIIDEINPSLNHQEFNFPSTELRKKYFEADIFYYDILFGDVWYGSNRSNGIRIIYYFFKL